MGFHSSRPRPRGVVKAAASPVGRGPQFWEPGCRCAAYPPSLPTTLLSASSLPWPSLALLPIPSSLLSGLAAPLPPGACELGLLRAPGACSCPGPAVLAEAGAPEVCRDSGRWEGAWCWQTCCDSFCAQEDPGRHGSGGGPAWKQGCQPSPGAPPSLQYDFPSWPGLRGSRLVWGPCEVSTSQGFGVRWPHAALEGWLS